ncbi:hypothetical protein AKJ45_01285, partial [candidate division MSBL1 archaeon SCGC-AAA261F19]
MEYDKIRKKYSMETPPKDNSSKNKKVKLKNQDEDFTKEELKEYEEVQTWLRTVSKSTKSSYLNTLHKFCNWCEKDPHELIMMRDEEKDIDDPNKRNRTKNLILDFREYLEKENYAPSSINTMESENQGLRFKVAKTTRLGNPLRFT